MAVVLPAVVLSSETGHTEPDRLDRAQLLLSRAAYGELAGSVAAFVEDGGTDHGHGGAMMSSGTVCEAVGFMASG